MKNNICNCATVISIFLVIFTVSAKCQQQDSTAVRKTNPTGALFRSALVPGWGQFYNRKYIKSAVIAGIEIYLINDVYTNARKASFHKDHFTGAVSDTAYIESEFALYEKALDRRGNATWFLAATIFFSMFDAYVDAHLSDFDQTDKAFDVYIGPGRDEDIKAVVTFYLP